MNAVSSNLRGLGGAIRAVLHSDAGADQLVLQARGGLLAQYTQRDPALRRQISRRRMFHRLLRRVPVVAALLVPSLFTAWAWRQSEVSFFVGDSTTTHGRLGDVLEAHGDVLTVRFAEGSQLLLQGNTRARVLTSERSAVRVLLESGELLAVIQPRVFTSPRWDIEAGPFRATVTGTYAQFSWDARSGVLRLVSQQGALTLNIEARCIDGSREVYTGPGVELACAHARLAEPNLEL
jgi:hypothetical protein